MENNDVYVDSSLFRPEAIPSEVKRLNEQLTEATKNNPRWFHVGAAKYREMRKNGETPLPKPVVLDGTRFEIPSRDQGRQIPCRVMKPDKDVKIKSVVMHIHGGGWVLMSEE
jgi:acetyl esterase/lipase